MAEKGHRIDPWDFKELIQIQDIEDLTNELSGKAPINHTHTIVEINALTGALDGKAGLVHVHPIDGVSGLQDELDSKADTLHDHDGDYASIEHVGDAVAHVTVGDRAVWDGKADGDHNHDGDYAPIEHVGDAVAHVTVGDRAAWDAKADGEHGHSIGEVLSLQATLDDLQAQINTSNGVILDRITGSAGSGAGTKTITLPPGIWDVFVASSNPSWSLYDAAGHIYRGASSSVSFAGYVNYTYVYLAYKVGV